jgi:segregation and condensation protein A
LFLYQGDNIDLVEPLRWAGRNPEFQAQIRAHSTTGRAMTNWQYNLLGFFHFDIIAHMSFQVAGHQTEGYRVNTPIFEGPLDLLLDLIEHAELDITTLALAQVTDQYLEYMHRLEEQNAAEVSGFLVIASRLLQIKSNALLPRPSLLAPTLEEEDTGEALARQLIIYKRFKELGAWINDRQEKGFRTYLRVVSPTYRPEPHLDLSGISIQDLVEAAKQVLYLRNNQPSLQQVVAIPRITIIEKIRSIINSLYQYGQTSFRSLIFRQNDRLEIVVTFLAMLELIKRRAINASQAILFGDIQLVATGEWDENVPDDEEYIE